MRWKMAVVGLFLVCLCAGCGGKEKQNGKRAASGTAVTGIPNTKIPATGGAVSGKSISAESELAKQSRIYAEQIVAGLFAPLMENLSEELFAQTTEESLQASWNSVAGNLTGYQGVESVAVQ